MLIYAGGVSWHKVIFTWHVAGIACQMVAPNFVRCGQIWYIVLSGHVPAKVLTKNKKNSARGLLHICSTRGEPDSKLLVGGAGRTKRSEYSSDSDMSSRSPSRSPIPPPQPASPARIAAEALKNSNLPAQVILLAA